eukprot:snap_masked-scaffold_26-processed-gene-0.17-mRNA-1 protein AED:1.00 eAED:1.00 QI:0/0/0/0/1/1/2/0/72
MKRAPRIDSTPYQSIVDTAVRPDISFLVNSLRVCAQCPTIEYRSMSKRIIKYLLINRDLTIKYLKRKKENYK